MTKPFKTHFHDQEEMDIYKKMDYHKASCRAEKTNPRKIHFYDSETIRFIYISCHAVFLSLRTQAHMRYTHIFLLPSLDIVQALALILSDSLQISACCFDHGATDKYQFKCTGIQLEEWACYKPNNVSDCLLKGGNLYTFL